MAHRRPLARTLALLALFTGAAAAADSGLVRNQGAAPGALITPLTVADLDQANDVQWLDGSATPLADSKYRMLWTTGETTTFREVVYGAGRSTTVRHLRLALAKPVAVGSVLALGNGALSVLRADVTGPGDPGDDKQWLAAERLDRRSVTTGQPGDGALVLWVLPPGTTTRALRFSHTPDPTDRTFNGVLGGAYLLSGRYADVSGQARAQASAGEKTTKRLIDGQEDSWGPWANGEEGGPRAVSAEDPVWVQLNFPGPVPLAGLEVFASNASDAQVEVLPAGFAGPLARAADGDWQVLKSFNGMRDWYPLRLRPNWLDLGATTMARALRYRMTGTSPLKSVHPHLKDKMKEGRRVWLDELQALMPLGDKPLTAAVLPEWPDVQVHPPIAVPFTLDRDGLVTLVIEDQDGKRVRNLISATAFPKGRNTAWWDGLDDSGRDVAAAHHGLYHVPGKPVSPGSYRVRGLVVPPVELRYELSADAAGDPPWSTADNKGGWGTNHTPPSCTAVIPAERNDLGKELVFVGSYVAEGGHGLFWIDLDGHKQGGVGWLGGAWTGAQSVTADAGDKPDPATAVYVVSGFEGEVRFTSLKRDLSEQILIKRSLPADEDDAAAAKKGKAELAAKRAAKRARNRDSAVGDCAAWNGLVVAAVVNQDELWVVDGPGKRLLGRIPLTDPHALTFAADGTLYATSGNALLALTLDQAALTTARGAAAPAAEAELPVLAATPRTVIAELDQPRGLAIDKDGDFVISEQGTHHQVRVYDRGGKLLRSIGKPGVPAAGPYDPQHMNRPAGVALDSRGRLWVTEAYTQPKRTSLWNADGTLVNAWYGPSRYGGGGTLDAYDRTQFHNAGMQFRIDWASGGIAVKRVLLLDRGSYPPDAPKPQFPLEQHGADGLPEQPHLVQGRRFFSNWTNGNPTNGASTAVVWEDRGGKLMATAAVGEARGWWVTESEPFLARWPAGITPAMERFKNPVWFAWQDANGDGVCQPDETVFSTGRKGGVSVMPDLSFITRLDDTVVRFPANVAASGQPTWDFAKPQVLLTGAQNPASSGGDTYLLCDDGRVVAYPPPKPGSAYSVGGGKAGSAPDWNYPNLWPGLHASHEAPTPGFPGMLIGPTRVLGPPVTPRGNDLGPLWFLNSNMGSIYVITSDGLFVAELFHDSRTAPAWRMPIAKRGMRVDELSLGQETFWPTVTQVQADGSIHLCTGAASVSSLVAVGGLKQGHRLPPSTLDVDQAALEKCLAWQAEAVRATSADSAPKVLAVRSGGPAPVVDGDLADWGDADWAVIDQRGVNANFNSDSRPYDVSAALRIVDGTLYAAWRTTEKDLLANSGEQPSAPFKTGGALDLMLATDPKAKDERSAAVAGDQRLLITFRPGTPEKNGKPGKPVPWAVRYRAVVPGTAAGARVPFSSPWRTITFDAVDDVTAQVTLAQKDGVYEVSVPLSVLGLTAPTPGLRLRGDLGVLRGTPGQTTQRIYWANKASGITADVPSEAQLQPGMWGTFVIK